MYDNYNVSMDPVQTSTVAMMHVMNYNHLTKEANNIFDSIIKFFSKVFQ